MIALLTFWRREAVLGVLYALAALPRGVLALVTGDAGFLAGSVAALAVGTGLVIVGAGVWSLLEDAAPGDS